MDERRARVEFVEGDTLAARLGRGRLEAVLNWFEELKGKEPAEKR